MKNEKFLQELEQFKMYLKPELYEVLVRASEVFTDEMRKDMINELEKADLKMEKLAIYEKQRGGIAQRGVKKLASLYSKAKAILKRQIQDEENSDKIQAEKIIANI